MVMGKREDQFQEKLAQLQAGEPLQACQADLAEDEADLLELVAALGEVPYPERDVDLVAEQRAHLLELAAQERDERAPPSEEKRSPMQFLVKQFIEPARAKLRALPRWVLPVAALSGSLAVLFVCVMLAVIGGTLAWRGLRGSDAVPDSPPVAISEDDGGVPSLPSPTVEGVAQPVSPLPSPSAIAREDDSELVHTVFLPSVFSPLPPHLAVLEDIRGVVEVQDVDGDWSVANGRQTVEAGTRVRTGALSGVDVSFYDGSTAYLGPNTEISIDVLGQDAEDQSRIVELTQWVGETDHDVAPSYGGNGHYEVHTPSGSGVAKGTFFHVSVTPALVVRFSVDEGAVEVTNVDVTVIVIAGQLTTIAVGEPPAVPSFRVTGEGEVSHTGDETWVIAGKPFDTHDGTIIVGNPQLGDWVHVDGHLGDGTRFADYIILLHRSPTNRFTITGNVDARDTISWTVAGREIAVGAETDIEEDEDPIEVGDLVHVEGVIEDNGTLLAESIRLVAEPGLSFTFVGVIESISDTHWVISGISVTVDAQTVKYSDPKVGHVVRAKGVIDEEDARVARSITLLLEPEYEFEFTGYVETINEDEDEWSVSGVSFEVNEWTEIEAGIVVSNLVKVEGRILVDGTRLATEIELADDDEALTFEFVGTVDDTDPLVVCGIALSVTNEVETEIEAGIVVSDLVKVEGQILLDGTWLATKIELVEEPLGQGCLQVAAIVFRADADLIVLQDGSTLPLDPETVIEGDLQANSVILFYLCYDDEGNVTVVSIVVIDQLEPVIIYQPPPPPPSQPPPPPGGGGSIVVNDNSRTQTFTCNGHSVTINGNDNAITLLGSCGSVTVRGNSNWVSIQSATSVTNTGNNNTIVGP
jgi:hypothetical protein